MKNSLLASNAGRAMVLAGALISALPSAAATLTGLTTVDNKTWDTTAVRKVMRTFAFGGHASDAQIKIWADTLPSVAITEMLNFTEHNLLLSPRSRLASDADLTHARNRLRNLSILWSSADPTTKMDPTARDSFLRSEGNGALYTWSLAA
ncbi:MAG: hypothetical protein EXR86_05570 [Gammaproteobacteria bacterium]|nr:hypothetical protein [Gammaproteobacteria bacterium]